MNKDWRNFTSEILFEHIGPVTEIIIDDTLNNIDVKRRNMNNTRDYLAFIKALYKELPKDIDRKSLCEHLWAEMMNQNIFV